MRMKVWLAIAAALVLLGGILFAGVMTRLDWDFTKLATVDYETNTYKISQGFDSILVDTDTADIEFVLSDDGQCKVVCHEEENAKHRVMVKDNTLTIAETDEEKRNHFIGFVGLTFETPKITVYLPKAEYDTLQVNGGTGRACVENISVGTMTISVSTGKVIVADVRCRGDITIGISTGDVRLTRVDCKNLTTIGDTGDLFLEGVIAQGKILLETDTGDVTLDGCDGGELSIETDTGDVTGSLLTEKIFVAETDTGRVDVPKTTTGGVCQVETDTGDIRLKIS